MGYPLAITADTSGRRDTYGLPPLTRNPGTPADRQASARWLTVQRRDPPGQSTDDRWQQARSFSNAVYIAVKTIMTALSGATVVVSVRRGKAVKKSASAAGVGESDWQPAPSDHPAVRLFEHVNERDTLIDFLAEYTMCRNVFGQGAIYVVPDGEGKPAELWNLRSNFLTSTTGLSDFYPSGSWRYYMPQPMLWGATGQLVIPRERVVLHRHPNPLWPWDGYSPLQAGGKLVDFLNSVIDSRQKAMDEGFTPDVFVNLPGASEDELRAFDTRISQNYQGQQRGKRAMVGNGERMEITPLNISPDKMSYPEGYSQGTAAVLALFGVPAVCAFLAEADYSGFYAAARAWREGNLNSEVNATGAVWTKHLIRPHWGPDVKVEIKLPPLMDPEQRERQAGTLLQAKAISRNEVRAMYDLPPLDGGDQTPDEFAAEVAKKNQPPQMPGMGGGVPGMSDFGGAGGGEGQDPLAAILGGADPTAEPSAPGEDDTGGPDVGAAAQGSRPGAVRKGFRFDPAAFFDSLVREVCP